MLEHKLNNNLFAKQSVPIAIAFVLLAIIHLVSLAKAQSRPDDIFILSFFYVITGWFYYQNFPKLTSAPKILPRLLGTLIAAYFSIRTITVFHNEFRWFWLIVLPFIFLGFALMINGWEGIKNFWRSLFGITVLSWLIPFFSSLAYRNGFLEKFSAQFSAYFLWYLGFPSESQGNYIFVNNNVVQVYSPCTAISILVVFLSLLLILTLYFPHLIRNIPLTVAIALGTGFFLSIIRIMIMALVVNDEALFSYWHGTTGSNIFTSIGVFLFGGYLLWQAPSSSTVSRSSSSVAARNKSAVKISPMMIMILWGFTGLLTTLFLFRQGNVNRYAEFVFPNNLPLPGWTLTQTQPLSPLTEMQIASQVIEQETVGEPLSPDAILEIRQAQRGTDIFISGHRYQYKNSDHKTELTATFRYIVNVDPE